MSENPGNSILSNNKYPDAKSTSIISLQANEKLDPDLPNFTLTKRLSSKWRISHVIFNGLFSLCFLVYPLAIFFLQGKFITLIYVIGSGSKTICSFMEWFHYKRGCIGNSNLNSRTKTNIDKSCGAIISRAKMGLLYFGMCVVCCVLFVNFLLSFKVDNEMFGKEKGVICRKTGIVFMGGMIGITVVQILKFEKIATPTKQYQIENDISNFFVEWFMLIGSIVYSMGLIDYVFKGSNLFLGCKKMHIYCGILGGGFFIGSVLAEYFRFFYSDDSDLNINGESNYSI